MSIIKKLYIDTSRGQVHGRMTARRSGLPLVLLHQTASSSAMYERLMAELSGELSADFWLVALDTPGFGQSFVPAERPSTSLYATVFWEALAELNISSCHLFGHHTGAAIAVQMAHDVAQAAPDRVGKLILSGPPLLNEAQIERLRAGLQPIVPDADGRFLSQTWQRLRHKAPDAPLDLSLRETLLTLQAGHSYPLAYEAVFDQPFAEQLAALSQPTLLLAGQQDSLHACLQPAHALLPHSTIRSLPHADGYLCDRQPARAAALLRQFLGD
jgi:haloalkane dehalogenase